MKTSRNIIAERLGPEALAEHDAALAQIQEAAESLQLPDGDELACPWCDRQDAHIHMLSP